MWAAHLGLNLSSWLQALTGHDEAEGRAHGKRLRREVISIPARVTHQSPLLPTSPPPAVGEQSDDLFGDDDVASCRGVLLPDMVGPGLAQQVHQLRGTRSRGATLADDCGDCASARQAAAWAARHHIGRGLNGARASGPLRDGRCKPKGGGAERSGRKCDTDSRTSPPYCVLLRFHMLWLAFCFQATDAVTSHRVLAGRVIACCVPKAGPAQPVQVPPG